MTRRPDLPSIWWLHDDCGCRKAPIVGARYRHLSRDLFSDEVKGWVYWTVVAVEPLRHDQVRCRRCTMRSDDGEELHPFVQYVFANLQAVDNVRQLRPGERPA